MLIVVASTGNGGNGLEWGDDCFGVIGGAYPRGGGRLPDGFVAFGEVSEF